MHAPAYGSPNRRLVARSVLASGATAHDGADAAVHAPDRAHNHAPPEEHSDREHTAREHTAREHTAREHTAREHTAREHTAREHTAREHTAREHTAREHTAREHTAREHTAREHTAREHTAREHAAREHTAREHTAREHAAREHAAREHAAREHAAREHAAREHAAREHAAREHAAREHAAREHAAREHAAREHAAREHAAREHAAREHSAREHSAREHSAREHANGEHAARDRERANCALATDELATDELANDGPTTDEHATLDARLAEWATRQGTHELDLAAHLLRAQDLELHRRFGFGSFTDYVARRLGLSTREAREKLRVARALTELPALRAALAAGGLSWSAARELTRVATTDDEAEWLAFAEGLTVRQLEHAVARRTRRGGPRASAGPDVPRRWVFELAAEDVALVRAALDAVWLAAGSDTVAPTQSVLLRMMAEVVLGRRAVDAPAYQTALTVCAGCARAWSSSAGEVLEVPEAVGACARCDGEVVGVAVVDEDGASAETGGATHVGRPRLLDDARAPAANPTAGATHVGRPSRATPHLDDVRERAGDPTAGATHVGRPSRATPHLDDAHDRARDPTAGAPHEAHLRDVAAHAGARGLLRLVTRALGVPLRSLTPRLRRQALARDGARCVVPGCRNARFVEVHHVTPRSRGGRHVLGNLACLCTSHHRAVHHGVLALEGSADGGWVVRHGSATDAAPRGDAAATR